jgi:hypothetical protein
VPDGEGAIAFLPFEVSLRAIQMHPSRGSGFDDAHRVSDGDGRWNGKEEMDVVVDASDGKSLHVVIAGDPAYMGPQSFLDIRRDAFAAPFVEKTQWNKEQQYVCDMMKGNGSVVFGRPSGAWVTRLRGSQGCVRDADSTLGYSRVLPTGALA